MTRGLTLSQRSAAWLLVAFGVSVLGGCTRHVRYLDAAFDPIVLTADESGSAEFSDPNLVNPVGLQALLRNGSEQIWVVNNATGTATIYGPDGAPLPAGTPLAVHLPAPPSAPSGAHAAPTDLAFYAGDGLEIQSGAYSDTARFLVPTLDGTILGYNSGVDQNNMLLAVDNSATGAAYWGIAATPRARHGAWVYATNFSAGTIDVFDETFAPAAAADLDPAAFEDPELPAEYAPFGICLVEDMAVLFVSYAERDADGRSPVAGEGKGFINAFALNGRYLGRVASEGDLNAPWGMTVSPWTTPYFGIALVVGNSGDGRVNVFSLLDGTPLGGLYTSDREPLAIDGLWGLTLGLDLNGYPALFYSAGPSAGAHGSFGMIDSNLIDHQ